MCFNKSSSASSQASSQVNRDERMAADNGALALALKDIEGSNISLAFQNVSADVIASSNQLAKVALDRNTNVANTAIKEGNKLAGKVVNLADDAFSGVLDFAGDVLGFAAASTNRSLGFAAETQAAFADTVRSEFTNDLTEVVNKAITAAAIIAGLYFAVRVLR